MSYLWDPQSSTDASYTSSMYFSAPSTLLSSRYLVGMPIKYGSSYYGILCDCYNHGTSYDVYRDRAVYNFYLTNLSSGEVLATYNLPLYTDSNNDSTFAPSGLVLGDDAFYFAYADNSGGFSYATNYFYIIKYDLLTGTTSTIDSKTVSSAMGMASCACLKDGSDSYFVCTCKRYNIDWPPASRVRLQYWIEKVDLSSDAATEIASSYVGLETGDLYFFEGCRKTSLSLDDNDWLYFQLSTTSSTGDAGLYAIKTDGTGLTRAYGSAGSILFTVGGTKGMLFARREGTGDHYYHNIQFDSGSWSKNWGTLSGFSNGVAGGYLLDGSSYPYYYLLFEGDDKEARLIELNSDETVTNVASVSTGTANWAKTIRSGGMIIDASGDDLIANGLPMWGSNGSHGVQIPQRVEVL